MKKALHRDASHRVTMNIPKISSGFREAVHY